MIRLRLLAVLALFVAGLGAALPAHAQTDRSAANLVLNPGAESGGLFSPTDWDTTVAGVPTVFFYWDPDVHHGGARSLSIVNAGDAIPVWHNWYQMIPNAGRFVGRDIELTAWARSQQMSGRGYVMVQCYRDTVTLYALEQGIPRDRARELMGFHYADDPQLETGWARQYFSRDLGDWTPLKVRVYVPPTTNLIVVRAGIFGPGQVWFDDIDAQAVPAQSPPPPVLGRNLLADPGFEKGSLDDWEFSMPPTPGASITIDSTEAHNGRYSLLLTSPNKAAFQTFMNANQVFNDRSLAGKRVRFSGWCKLDGVTEASAYLNVFSTGGYGTSSTMAGNALFGTLDWTFYSVEFDVPKDTYTVWARAGYQAVPGRCWWDDLKFEVLGNTPASAAAAPGRKAR